MFTRIDHIGIACHDLDRTVAFYRETFGFEVAHTEVNEDQGVREAMIRVNGTDDGGATWLQLLAPVRDDSAIAKWLATRGEGVHHVASAHRPWTTPPPRSPGVVSGCCSTRRGPPPWAPGRPFCTPRTATGCSSRS